MSKYCEDIHKFRNEDGKEYEHPGYKEIPCARCGRVIVQAKTNNILLCGDRACMKQER